MTALRLPRFTFLLSAPGAGDAPLALAEAINALDPRLATWDFLTPVYTMVEDTFLGGMDLDFDISTVDARATPVEWLNPPMTGERPWLVGDLVKNLRDSLRSNYGDDVLGILALRAFEAEAPVLHDVYDRYLFRDATTLTEIMPFVEAFPTECLILVLSSAKELDNPVDGVPMVWLPEPDAASQIDRLRKELAL
jgi:hypothetical protein